MRQRTVHTSQHDNYYVYSCVYSCVYCCVITCNVTVIRLVVDELGHTIPHTTQFCCRVVAPPSVRGKQTRVERWRTRQQTSGESGEIATRQQTSREMADTTAAYWATNWARLVGQIWDFLRYFFSVGLYFRSSIQNVLKTNLKSSNLG